MHGQHKEVAWMVSNEKQTLGLTKLITFNITTHRWSEASAETQLKTQRSPTTAWTRPKNLTWIQWNTCHSWLTLDSNQATGFTESNSMQHSHFSSEQKCRSFCQHIKFLSAKKKLLFPFKQFFFAYISISVFCDNNYQNEKWRNEHCMQWKINLFIFFFMIQMWQHNIEFIT